jgi:ubiquinone biosynthesis UbiH/UbiF/VisC/COQ6 family hydroxylase
MRAAQQFQVAIIGGGIVGSALALVLSRAGIETALLEKNTPPKFKSGQDYGLRVSAVSLASEYLLRNLDAWHEIAAARVSPYREMHVWDADGTATLHFDCAELQQPYLGHIIENDLLQSVLHDQIHKQPTCRVLSPVDLQDIKSGARSVVLKLNGQPDISAQLLVGADGADSIVRRSAGIDVEYRQYGQSGLVCVIKTTQSHQNTAWQRFMQGGPLALLPLKDDYCSIVWSQPDTEAKRLLNLDEKSFCTEISDASGHCLGDVLSCGPRAVFPLCYQQAETYTKARLALIGDAAHVVHPLAGQGVNLGLLDVAELGQLMVGSNSNRDLGSLKLLRRYERSRRHENVIMGLAFDLLNRLYAGNAFPLVDARNLGMSIVNRLHWLKRFFMQRATGLEQAGSMHQQACRQGKYRSLLTPPEYPNEVDNRR